MDKILRINVGSENGPSYKIDSLEEYAGMGGRAMTSAIISKEVPPDCHPLGEDNKLVIAPGLMSGSAASTSGRISVGCKSPLTGGIKEANSGGQAAQYMGRLGYAAIVLEGKQLTDDTYKIFISKDKIEISLANDLKGLRNYALAEKIKDSYGDKVAMMSIGPAGEMKMCAASIAVTDTGFRPSRHAGRGGVGAVMGAKGIKAIIFDTAGTSIRKPKDPEKFKEANKKFVKGIREHAVTGEALPTYGTNVLTNIINDAGGYPAYNFKEAQYNEANKISGETFADLEKSRGGKTTHGCHSGCAIQCSGIFVDKKGQYVTKQPEYETVWAHGANCGISDPDAIAKMDFLDDDIGLDTIEMGVTYATSPMGGDHTAGYTIATNILKAGGYVDPLSKEGQIKLSRDLQIAKALAVIAVPLPIILPNAEPFPTSSIRFKAASASPKGKRPASMATPIVTPISIVSRPISSSRKSILAMASGSDIPQLAP